VWSRCGASGRACAGRVRLAILSGLASLGIVSGLAAWPGAAAAQPVRAPGEAVPSVARETSLDGMYLALGPTAALVRVDGQWDGGFGGEISLVRVREREPLSALGLAAGALRLTADDRGRAWSEVLAGARLAGVHAGLGAGASVDIDAVRAPRWGGHVTVWIFAGVVPYARAGVVEGVGSFVEVGIKVAFPVVDWPVVDW
jgi:hypothetical protein